MLLLALCACARYPQTDQRKMIGIDAASLKLGSTPEEVRGAFELCSAYRADCKMEWFSPEGRSVEATVGEYYLDRDEVSWAAYGRCVEAHACKAVSFEECWGFMPDLSWKQGFVPSVELMKTDHPALCVNYFDAENYCTWAGKRLPTDAEWELAARGIERRTFPWGREWRDGAANIGKWDAVNLRLYGDARDGYLETSPVDAFSPGATPDGVRNLAGNVWEWVSDAEGDKGFIRGGGWFNEKDMVRTAERTGMTRTSRHVDLGFRCAWSPRQNAPSTKIAE